MQAAWAEFMEILTTKHFLATALQEAQQAT
jgi:hypothetical protein